VIPADGTPLGSQINPNIPITWATFLASGPYPPSPGNAVTGSSTLPSAVPSSTTGFPPAADCHQIDDYMDTTNYIGAFDPNGGPGANWLDTGFGTNSLNRWISFDTN
ncbi:MAG TPA: hypothetical protein VL403_18485, partial [Candidatus Kryptonia bacterium]|nr:hypothetical protein [Candidatus Kryptonia bacterium]